jgi:hypothetical protein
MVMFWALRVRLYVSSFKGQLAFVTDDALVIPSLPDGGARSPAQRVDLPRRERLKRTNDLRQPVLHHKRRCRPTPRRGGFQTRPHANLPTRTREMHIPEDNDPMNMVRHYHKRIQPDTRVMIRQIRPAPAHHFRVPVLDHPAMRYPTEQGFTTCRTDRNEIRARRRVIVALQPDAAATGDFGTGRRGRSCPPVVRPPVHTSLSACSPGVSSA